MLAAKDIYFLKQEKVMIKTGPPPPPQLPPFVTTVLEGILCQIAGSSNNQINNSQSFEIKLF